MPAGAEVGYKRVSSIDQNPQRQLEGIHLDKVFTDVASGKNTDRPELKRCLDYLREGDTFHLHSLDRLARNLADLQKIVHELTERGVSIVFHKENLHFNAGGGAKPDPMTLLLFQVLGAFSELERNLIRERQAEGIAIAKRMGKYKGRKPKLTQEKAEELKRRAAAGERISDLARAFGVSRETVYVYLKDKPAKAAGLTKDGGRGGKAESSADSAPSQG